MSNVPVIIAGAVAVITLLFIINRITGFVFRLVVLAVLVAFLYYLYQSGFQEMIMAPGAPESEILKNVISYK